MFPCFHIFFINDSYNYSSKLKRLLNAYHVPSSITDDGETPINKTDPYYL